MDDRYDGVTSARAQEVLMDLSTLIRGTEDARAIAHAVIRFRAFMEYTSQDERGVVSEVLRAAAMKANGISWAAAARDAERPEASKGKDIRGWPRMSSTLAWRRMSRLLLDEEEPLEEPEDEPADEPADESLDEVKVGVEEVEE